MEPLWLGFFWTILVYSRAVSVRLKQEEDDTLSWNFVRDCSKDTTHNPVGRLARTKKGTPHPPLHNGLGRGLLLGPVTARATEEGLPGLERGYWRHNHCQDRDRTKAGGGQH